MPQYAFGHDLSHTTFKYSGLSVTPGPQSATVKLAVTNNGKVAWTEVVYVYVKDKKASAPRPDKKLKGFEKVFLKPGIQKLLPWH